MKKALLLMFSFVPICATVSAEGGDAFWEGVWSGEHPDREIPVGVYKDMLNMRNDFLEKGYSDCAALVREFASDDVVTESELKRTIECQGRYQAEEEKVEIIRTLKE